MTQTAMASALARALGKLRDELTNRAASVEDARDLAAFEGMVRCDERERLAALLRKHKVIDLVQQHAGDDA